MTNERAYTPSLVLHVLRNPHGWSAEAITAARLQAADEIERLQGEYNAYRADGEPELRAANAEIMRLLCREQQLMEFLRSFISGGVNQDFKPWAREMYQKLYSSHEPCEQHGPFAGLQSLSFDVSENPTIALVMRFDNIEHAQAARDQLWQPAGAARDASSGERWPKSIAGEAPWCKCPDGDCAGWDEAINHGCCCRVANGR